MTGKKKKNNTRVERQQKKERKVGDNYYRFVSSATRILAAI